MLHGAYHFDPQNVLGYERDMLPSGETLDFVSLTAPQFSSPGQFFVTNLGNIWNGTTQDITDLMGPSTSRRLLTHMTPYDDKTNGNTAPYDYTPFLNGQYDSQVRDAARLLINAGCPDAMLVIGGEWNHPNWTFGNWPTGGAPMYNDMFAKMVDLLSSVSGADFTFLIQVAGTVGEAGGCDPMSSSNWPSGQEPPLFETTFYDSVASVYQGLPDAQITQAMRDDAWFNHTKPTLEQYVQIAEGIGSPICTKEWGGEKAASDGRGNGGGDNPSFIHRAFDFMHANGYTMEGYWNGAPHSIWPLNDPTDLVEENAAYREEVAADIAGGGGSVPSVGNYVLPQRGQTEWDTTLNAVFGQVDADVTALGNALGVSVTGGYARPAHGSTGWNVPIGDNFEAIDADVQQLAAAAGVTGVGGYASPQLGQPDWDVPLNNTLAEIDSDLKAIAAAL